MSSIGIDIEMLSSYAWEAVYATRYELLGSLVFLVGWLLGKRGWFFGKVRMPPSPKYGLKQSSYKRGSVQPRRKSPENTPRLAVPFRGSIDQVDPMLLKDPSWVVPQVTQLCQTQVPQALLLHRASIQAGLKLVDIPAEDCHQLFVALVTAVIRTGRFEDAMKLLLELRDSGLGVRAGLVASVVKLCTSKQLFAESLAVFDFMSEDATYTLTDKSIWSCLLFCATEAKAHERCSVFFERVKAHGTASAKDYGNMLRIAAVQRDWEGSLMLIQEMRDANLDIDIVLYNTSLATCVGAGKVDQACVLLDAMEKVVGVADVVTYNTILKGFAKASQIDDCFKLLDRMHTKSIPPSQVTYGILLDSCINENEVHRAKKVVDDMTVAGCPMNVILYTTLIKGFARAGDLEQVMGLYQKMRADQNTLPDLITFSILIKANCDNDKLEEALKLLEDMIELGLRPDEVVFNNLIAGCARLGNVMLGKQLYDNMVKSGVRPSNATFSILIRLHHQSNLLEEAILLLKTEPAKHHVEAEPRLFLQLIQSCIRSRQGKQAIQAYEMLCERSKPTGATHNSILTTCLRLNMYDTAAEIISIAAANRGRVDASDTKFFLETAFKKRKTQAVQSCIAAMRALGHPVDPQFVSSVESNPNPVESAPWKSR